MNCSFLCGMAQTQVHTFMDYCREAAASQQDWLKCTLALPVATDARSDLKSITIRPVLLKKGPHFAFNFRYKTRDEVKNYTPEAALLEIENLLGTHFMEATLQTTHRDAHLRITPEGATLRTKAPTQTAPADLKHDKTKVRLLDPAAPWLHALGITTAKGEVLANAQDKWRQINKFLEIISNLHREKPLPTDAQIADMGSGKGYLTFALYNYLTDGLGLKPQVTGIELRPNLVELCNKLAQKVGYQQLTFVAEDIRDFPMERLDMLIALHACDTATDLAIAKGLSSKAEIVVVAPCCHKQIRRDMHPANELSPVLKHGILEERQAEIVTDGIRALLLEANGYKTSVFEFISTEHTAKNVMITALKKQTHTAAQQKAALDKVAAIKAGFGIEKHYLETII
jgi:SAM-dependent methyltransferase